MPIAVDATYHHVAAYMHCSLGGTNIPDQLSSCWLLEGSAEWAALYAASLEAVHFNQQI